MELFFTHINSDAPLYQVAFDPHGQVYDAQGENRNWDSHILVKSAESNPEYTWVQFELPLSDFGYAFTVAFADGTPPEGLCLVSPSWNPNEPRKWADATLFLPSGTPEAKAVLAELTPLPVKANHSLPDSRISLFAWFPSAPTNATAPPVLETRVLDEPYSAKNVTRKVLKIFELLAPDN